MTLDCLPIPEAVYSDTDCKVIEAVHDECGCQTACEKILCTVGGPGGGGMPTPPVKPLLPCKDRPCAMPGCAAPPPGCGYTAPRTDECGCMKDCGTLVCERTPLEPTTPISSSLSSSTTTPLPCEYRKPCRVFRCAGPPRGCKMNKIKYDECGCQLGCPRHICPGEEEEEEDEEEEEEKEEEKNLGQGCICPAVYAPVCDVGTSKSKRFSNSCEAECYGVTVYKPCFDDYPVIMDGVRTPKVPSPTKPTAGLKGTTAWYCNIPGVAPRRFTKEHCCQLTPAQQQLKVKTRCCSTTMGLLECTFADKLEPALCGAGPAYPCEVPTMPTTATSTASITTTTTTDSAKTTKTTGLKPVSTDNTTFTGTTTTSTAAAASTATIATTTSSFMMGDNIATTNVTNASMATVASTTLSTSTAPLCPKAVKNAKQCKKQCKLSGLKMKKYVRKANKDGCKKTCKCENVPECPMPVAEDECLARTCRIAKSKRSSGKPRVPKWRKLDRKSKCPSLCTC